MRILDPNEVESQYDDVQEVRSRKATARRIAAIGSWNAEEELRMQERAYKSARKSDPHVSGISDSFPQGTPKHRRASKSKSRSITTACIGYKLRDPALYFYKYPLIHYVSAYNRGLLTKTEIQEILRNVALMK